ncbi:prepilin peptidase [Streptomyces nitrosporeus]|uniref:prepilin peptidase n=1 Tax=Streptomyces nitrosporeus TaxID=28894 RepID=UPI0039A0B3ED
MDATLIAVAVLWGAATGPLLPRAAYRFAVEPEEALRDSCPAGHTLGGPALGRGWIGSTTCASCATAPVPVHAGDTARAHPQTPGTPVPPAPRTAPGATAPETAAPAPGAAAAEARSAAPGAAASSPEARDPAPGAQAPEAPASDPGPGAGEQVTRNPRYAPRFLAPAVNVLACAALAWAVGPRPELLVWLLAAPVAVLLAVIDHRVHRLPDPLTLPLAAGLGLLLGATALHPEHAGSWTTALLGGAGLGGFYFLLFLINPNGMGFGDVKLALSLGMGLGWYGWGVLFAGGFAGFLLGALYGACLMLLRRAGRRTGIPFGPFMITGALLGLLSGGLAG